VLVGYDAVKEAMVDQADDFTGRGQLPFVIRVTKGYGLGISNGERWHQLRRFTLATLRDFGMGRKGMEEWIQEESKHLRARIAEFKEKMQHEIDVVIGKNRCPNMEDRKSLPFTDAVIHEVQRFLDIVPFSVPHHALHDISFRGYTIPKVLSNPYFILIGEKEWATPWSFNPQHFLDQNGNFKKNPAFLPFSAGKRSCVGESLARMELFIFLVSLLQHFTFSCTEGPDSINLIPEYSSFANLPRRYQIIATPR
uniref:Cytochrome P450, family 2, subfamily Y, polypeptide 3 n=1 Tax=Mastacembelus armatus TaxID=205130 RepID=A0A3Q3SDC0_9TELE